MTRLTLIAAVAQNSALGRNNQLLWHLPNDLQFFKKTTLNHPIIMGRKTYESIGRALPGRLNIVVSRELGLAIEGCIVVFSLQSAIQLAEQMEHQPNDKTPEIFIIGGGEIYAQALPLAQRIVLTEVKKSFPADVFFPKFDRREWQEISRESNYDSTTDINYDFVDYQRIHLK